MKRFLALASIIALFACSKPEAIKTTTVTFSIGNIMSGSMTKGVDDVLAATAPQGPFSIKLVSTTNSKRSYTINTGVATNIICDTYKATCEYRSSDNISAYYSIIYYTPTFVVDQTIEISDASSSVSLTATYDCWALVIDSEKTSYYECWEKAITEMSLSDKMGNGVLYFCATTPWTENRAMHIYAHPVDDANFQTTEYALVSSATSTEGYYYVENGKWYIFNPSAASSVSGTIGVSFSQWGEGGTIQKEE